MTLTTTEDIPFPFSRWRQDYKNYGSVHSRCLPPPPKDRKYRSRALSSGVRPKLSIATLSRSATATSQPDYLATASTADSASSSKEQSSDSLNSPVFIPPSLKSPRNLSPIISGRLAAIQNMVPVLVARAIDLWRVLRSGPSSKLSADLFATPDSSPRSSTDTDYILPLSSSPRKASFDHAALSPPQSASLFRIAAFPPISVSPSLLFVIILFPFSTAITLMCLSTLPITFEWPRTLSDLAQVGRDLNMYSQSGPLQTAHIIGVLSISAAWKHAWSVPGSVLWNVLAGALFHPFLATLVMTILTTIGSVCATLLATPLAPVLTRLFPRPVEMTRAALEGSTSSSSSSGEPKSSDAMTPGGSTTTNSPAWVRLSVLRLVGIVPWSALNIACGLTGVPLRDCIAGAFIGCLPWTAVTCQIGDILQMVGQAHSSDGLGDGISSSETIGSVLAQPSMIFELVFLTILSLAPILGRSYLSKLISRSVDNSTENLCLDSEKECSLHTSSKKEYPFGLGAPADKDEEFDFDDISRRGRRIRRQRWTWKRLSVSVPRWQALHSPLRHSFPVNERDSKS
ncbi:transmembrane 41a [Pyrrhoderma noxium]|uniref:Transmembrane 41a n=1 Tax=Pyrrhoderma noxium TaxID=2282107 RepID=A0A286UMQ1_9AGAM|nr:transmembrane 41a [Pyrrhoderma noxium]